MIAIIVLAAGKSSRARENKLLAQAPAGGTLIGQTVDHAIAAGTGRVIVVTGHQAEQVKNALAARPVRFIHALDYAEGIAASLRAGIATLERDVRAALICLGDMPLVDPGDIRRIIEAYDPVQRREIIVPAYQGKRGNPVLWGKRFFPELLQLTGDSGGRVILQQHAQFIAEIAVTTEAVRMDFDTPEQLTNFKRNK